MAVIKAAEFAWPRMEAPDLDEMEEFLTHFGLIRAERTPTALYMRGPTITIICMSSTRAVRSSSASPTMRPTRTT